jgi:hypothetical protein
MKLKNPLATLAWCALLSPLGLGQAPLESKTAEMKSLSERATAVTKTLGELASTGKIPVSDEAIELMRKMVEELALIRRQLDKVEAEVELLKAERKIAKPAAFQTGSDKTKLGGYLQVQYRDTNQRGGANDAFSVRRARIGISHQADAHFGLKVTFDVATGTNQANAQLRDAFLTYAADPKKERLDLSATAGQQALPLGYELQRSSSEREFPERALYNQRMFAGDRGRGVNVRYGLGESVSLQVGGWNALTTGDPEQSSLAPGPESRHAVTAALRAKGSNYEVGVSAFRGERPQFTSGSGSSAVTHGRVDREFLYVDGHVDGILHPNLYVRGEAMWGKDRLPVTGTPSAPASRTDMAGYQLQVGYRFDPRNGLHFRFEQFDPDTDTAGNAVIGYGAAWTHQLSSGARLTAAHEIFDDAARSTIGQQRYHVTTIRVQLKY